MRFPFCIALYCFLSATAAAASKPHVITFGKWTVVKSSVALDESPPDLKVRPLYVDGRLKEFTFGVPHEVTEQLFVVRRVVRVNDTLPQETATTRWTWERGGWLEVNRVTGHIAQASLPEFDPDFSSASWYRDYIAYCGISDDGRKRSAVVIQLGRRKPILKKPLGEAAGDDHPPHAPHRLATRPHTSKFRLRGRSKAHFRGPRPRGRSHHRRRLRRRNPITRVRARAPSLRGLSPI